MVFLLILGIIDILAGAVLALSASGWIAGGDFLFYLTVIFIIKGLWSMVSSAATGFYFDFLGIADVVAGVSMFLIGINVISGVFFWIGVIMIFKGLYSVFLDLPIS